MKLSTNVPAFVLEQIHTLRDERKKLGFNLRQLSELTGVSSYTIDNYECGRKTAQKTYNKLAAFFHWKEW